VREEAGAADLTTKDRGRCDLALELLLAIDLWTTNLFESCVLKRGKVQDDEAPAPLAS
jgi:hypothetical protein